MKNLERSIKCVIFAAYLSGSLAFGAEYVCDAKKELNSRSLIKIPHSSEKFKQVYTGIRQEYENSIAKICEFNKKCKFSPDGLGEKEIREAYAKTSWGKKESTDLKKMKDDFQYTSVDNYLFDQNKLNFSGSVSLTHTARKEDRTFYINEDKVVGYLDQAGEEGVFYRYDSRCDVSEIVSFAKLATPENAIRLKVTKKYCSNSQNKGATFKHSENDIRGWGAYFENHEGVEDQMEAEELCSQWIAKPEPIGLVVQAPSVEELEAKSKNKKGKKSKKKDKEKAKSSKKKKKESANNNPFEHPKMESVENNPFKQPAVGPGAEPSVALEPTSRKPEKKRVPVSVIDPELGEEAAALEEVHERQPKPSKKKKGKTAEPPQVQEKEVEAFGE